MHKNSVTTLNKSMKQKNQSIVVTKTNINNKPFTNNIRPSTNEDNSTSTYSSRTFPPFLIEKLNSSSFKNSSLTRPTTAKTNRKATSKQRHLTIDDFYEPEVHESSKDLLTLEEDHNFIDKFGQLAESIAKLIASEESLDPHSLDTVLSREIAHSLGSTIDNPKLSQQFIQATRNLLDNLVCLFEGGGINSQLLTTQPFILKAKSSTTICYRDQYLKDLIMNLLYSMCSKKLEEEINQLRSTASNHRIHAIRSTVRAEAGIEPGVFLQLQQELEDFQRTLTKNKRKALKATIEVERIIAEHLKRKTSSLNSLQIPNTEHEDRRGCGWM